MPVHRAFGFRKNLKSIVCSSEQQPTATKNPQSYKIGTIQQPDNLNLTEEQEVFLDEVNDFNLEVRYPQYKNEFHKKCTKQFSANYYQKINEMMKWLRSQIK